MQLQKNIGNRAVTQLLSSRLQQSKTEQLAQQSSSATPPIQGYWLRESGNTTWVGAEDTPSQEEIAAKRLQKSGQRQWKYRFLPGFLNTELDVWETTPEQPEVSRDNAGKKSKTKELTRPLANTHPSDDRKENTGVSVSTSSPSTTIASSKPALNELPRKELLAEILKREPKKNETGQAYLDRLTTVLVRLFGSTYRIEADDRERLAEAVRNAYADFTSPSEQASASSVGSSRVRAPQPTTGRTYQITDLQNYNADVLTDETVRRIQERITNQNEGGRGYNFHVGVGGVPTMDVTGTQFSTTRGRGDVRLQFLSDGSLRLVDHSNRSYL